MAALAAVDLGAQSGRVALGQFDGARLDVAEVHRFTNEPVRDAGVLRWNLPRLYQDVLDGLRAARGHATIDSLAVDSWGVDFGLLDGAGELIENPVHYRDERRASAVQSVHSRIPPRELYQRTGIQLMPINTVFELAAMSDGHDPALDRAETLLLIPDLFHHWLCGSRTSEYTNATTSQCLDVQTGGWAIDLLERLDIPARLFPEIVTPGTPLGPLSADVAAATGIDRATAVAVGTHDTASAVAAVPLHGPGSVYLSIGTWSLVGVETHEPLIDDNAFAANLTNEGGVAGTVRLLRNVTGLWLLHECRRIWGLEGREHSFEEMIALSGSSPPLRSFIDPDDGAFASPGDIPARVDDFCARTGQQPPGDPGAVVRCILESIALKQAQVVRTLGAVTGREPAELHIVGGGVRNELLCEWTAEAAGLPVLAGPEEATLFGNCLVQAMALGEISSLAEAREVVKRSVTPTTYEPADSPEWREARARFAQITEARSELEVTA